MDWFTRFENKCDYCEEKSDKKYCSYQCTHRAQILRNGVIRPEKMPKKTDGFDERYCQNYVMWLHLNREDLK